VTDAKALRVIPNKMFDARACQRALITGDAPAAREALTDPEHVWLCRFGDEEALADAIATVRQDPGLRNRIAKNGHELFQRRFSTAALAPEIGRIVREVIDGSGGATAG
jgi:glycosyltransferase involved in cell wall biosynthesis